MESSDEEIQLTQNTFRANLDSSDDGPNDSFLKFLEDSCDDIPVTWISKIKNSSLKEIESTELENSNVQNEAEQITSPEKNKKTQVSGANCSKFDPFCDVDLDKAIDLCDMFGSDGPTQKAAYNMHPLKNHGPDNYKEEGRFVQSKERLDEITLASAVTPKQTKKKAEWAHCIYQSWRGWKEDSNIPELLSMTESTMNDVLSRFLTEVRKQDGSRYPGKSLLEIVCSLQKFLSLHGKHIKLIKNPVMPLITLCLDKEMMTSANEGLGMVTKNADYVTTDMEKILWDKGILGSDSPLNLLCSVFYIIGTNFGLRSGQEHRNLTISNFTVQFDLKANREYVTYTETVSKTYKGGLGDKGCKPRSAKLYAAHNISESSTCPVFFFKAYISRCPQQPLINSFYLRPKAGKNIINDSIWYAAQPIGHNTLQSMVKSMMTEADIPGNFSNHSLRVTTATRLFQSGISEQMVQAQTGHRSTAVRQYKRPSVEQQIQVSEIINNKVAKSEVSSVSADATIKKEMVLPYQNDATIKQEMLPPDKNDLLSSAARDESHYQCV